ncbi:MAG: helix-hairpin-helix domain-containing protein, partial [Myxococcota bacterium]
MTEESSQPNIWLEGRLSRVVWASDDGGYAVVRLRTLQGEVTAVGALAMLSDQADDEAFVAIEGRWEEHSVHGRQFRSTGFLQGLPKTELGLKVFLAQAGIKGVGKKTADAIVDAFGVSALRIISEEPERLLELKAVTKARFKAITGKWEEAAKGAALAIRLRGLGIPPRTVKRIRDRYGEQALAVVGREPYRLAEEITGVGFKTADSLAREQGLPLDDPARVRAAALYALERAQNDGHVFIDRAQLTSAVAALTVPTDEIDGALDGVAMDRRVVIEPALDQG